jgi:hypothetical protein
LEAEQARVHLLGQLLGLLDGVGRDGAGADDVGGDEELFHLKKAQ